MRTRVLSLAAMMLGIAICLAASGELALVALAAGSVLAAVGAIALATSLGRGRSSRAVLRLDVFLPFLKKRKKNAAPSQPPLIVRVAQRFLPRSLSVYPHPKATKKRRCRHSYLIRCLIHSGE